MYIVFEGPEGGGKTSQIQLLIDQLATGGYTAKLVREPGGTLAGETIRSILLDPAITELSEIGEVFLFNAARHELVQRIILPALNEGQIVIADRSYFSTRAYQGYGRGIPLKVIDDINSFSMKELQPDLILLLDLDPKIGLKRRLATNETNRLDHEVLEFHQRVREGFLEMAAEDPERWRVVDASRSIEEVHEDVLHHVLVALKSHEAGSS